MEPAEDERNNAADGVETKNKFQKAMRKAMFISKLRVSARNTLGHVEEHEHFLPVPDRRRFLFDDEALSKGTPLKHIFTDEERPKENFHDIVDMDEEDIQHYVSSHLVGTVVESLAFRVFIFALIIVNAIVIGLQTDETLSVKYRNLFDVFDDALLATFILEIFLKWHYGFWVFWKVGWNVLDFAIVLALLVGPQLAFLSSSRILRMLRVLRALRSLRSIGSLGGLSTVVTAIWASIPDMTNIVLLLFILLLVFAVSGVTLFGKIIPSRFGDLPTALFSLFICVTQDGWVDIYSQFQKSTTLVNVAGALYLFLVIMIGAFVFANLVVAVVVTNLEVAMREASQDANKAEQSEDGPKTEDADQGKKPPIVDYATIKDTSTLQSQNPLQLTDLRRLNTCHVEKYFMVLYALEENLAEYKSIKKDIEQMYKVVHQLNGFDDPGVENARPHKQYSSVIDVNELRRGDILSNLIKLENMAVDEDAANIGDIIHNVNRAYSQSAGPRRPTRHS